MKTPYHPNKMYYASAVYLRRRYTFTAIFWVRLTHQFDASSARRTPPRRKVQKNNKCSKQIDNSIQHELESCCFCDHDSPNISKLWLLLCFLRVYFQYVTTGISLRHIPKGNLVHIHIIHKCVFSPFVIFFSSGRGSFLVLSAPCHAVNPPGPNTQVWVPAEVRGTCSGG